MNEQIKTDFLRQRMTQLRERNGYSLSQLATELHANKSTLSRAEMLGGKTGFKTVHDFARRYCEFFEMSEQQINQFLRGERAVLVDTSVLFKRPDLLGELGEEYSCIFIPGFVIDELKDIKDNNPDDYGSRALDLLNKIQRNDRVHTKNYSIPSVSELAIVDIAKAVSEELGCSVDIITNDAPLALKVKGCIKEESVFQLVFLEEYVATKQQLIDMRVLNLINNFYADSYENIEEELEIRIPPIGDDNWNCYLADGTTLIISAIKNTEMPVEQRKEKIRWLLERGADIDKRDHESKNFPPLTHAIKMRDYEMFRFLFFECCANPNIGSRNPYDVGKIRQKNDGNTPLMVAAWEKQIDIVRDLCSDKRVSLNQQDGNGFTALIKACYWGNKECRKLIEDAGADKTIFDHEGFTAEDRWDECIRIGRYKEKR